MSNSSFRPWGQHSWLLPRLPDLEWSFLGAGSTEDRSCTAWNCIHSSLTIRRKQIIRVIDPLSRYTPVAEKLSDLVRQHFLTKGFTHSEIVDLPLFVRIDTLIQTIEAFKRSSTENIILDISAFPKRFFFPILRLLFERSHFKNILITYTVPGRYASNTLSEDPEPWRHIPLFAPPYPEKEVRLLFVSVGFEPLALPDLLEADYHGVTIKLLFPFPPGPPAFQRTWEFVRTIEDNLALTARDPIRVDARDVSAAFDHIAAATDNGREYAAFGPYGPKTISLAICIYAILAQCPVYYTQPRVYNPYYSSGFAILDGEPETYCYTIRLDGVDLFKL